MNKNTIYISKLNQIFNKKRGVKLDADQLPIAGLKKLSVNKNVYSPIEIINEKYKPLVVIDLDETIWPHIETFLKAVSLASGVPANIDDLIKFHLTVNIPQWKNKDILKIHDLIYSGNHNTYTPYVNEAYQEAIEAVWAIKHMGHHFCYLTGRPSTTYELTKKTLNWNKLPVVNKKMIDPITHKIPEDNYLYCSHVSLQNTGTNKAKIVENWMNNLREQGWEGELVIIDDMLQPFYDLLDNEKVTGISIEGVLNKHQKKHKKELRVSNWLEISDFFYKKHKEVLNADKDLYRYFDLRRVNSRVLKIPKAVCGNEKFSFEDLSDEDVYWM